MNLLHKQQGIFLLFKQLHFAYKTAIPQQILPVILGTTAQGMPI